MRKLNHEKFKTKAAIKLSVVDYLVFYNDCRSHSITLGIGPSNFDGIRAEFF